MGVSKKYRLGELYDLINKTRDKISEIDDEWADKRLNDPRRIRLTSRLDKLKEEQDEIKYSMYSDFDVHTSEERARDVRLDRAVVHGEAML